MSFLSIQRQGISLQFHRIFLALGKFSSRVIRLCPLLAVVFGYFVNTFVTNALAHNVVLDVFLVTSFALTLSQVISLVVRRFIQEQAAHFHAVHLVVLLHAIVWGRAYFVGTFFHDEFGYFQVLLENISGKIVWIFHPLNEHFQPVYKFLLAITLELFRLNFFGTALFSFLSFLVLIHGLFLCLQFFAKNHWIALLASALFVISPLHHQVVFWKAAGTPLCLSVGSFLFFLFCTGEWLSSARTDISTPLVKISLFAFLSVFSSSLITVPVLFLLPLAVVLFLSQQVNQLAFKRLLLVFCSGILITVCYFVLRNIVLHIRLPHSTATNLAAAFTLLGTFGATLFFREQLLEASSSWWLSLALLTLGLGLPTLLFFSLQKHLRGRSLTKQTRKEGSSSMFSRDSAAFLLCTLGSLILLISITQIWYGRGLVLWVTANGRYTFFPLIGITFFLAGIFSGLTKCLCLAPRGVSLFSLAIMLGLAAFFLYDAARAISYPQAPQTIEDRQRFFRSLENLVCAAKRTYLQQPGTTVILPDFSLGKNPNLVPLDIQPPFNLRKYGHTLEYYAKIYGSSCFESRSMPFARWEELNEEQKQKLLSLPEGAEFFSKYFPNEQRK